MISVQAIACEGQHSLESRMLLGVPMFGALSQPRRQNMMENVWETSKCDCQLHVGAPRVGHEE